MLQYARFDSREKKENKNKEREREREVREVDVWCRSVVKVVS